MGDSQVTITADDFIKTSISVVDTNIRVGLVGELDGSLVRRPLRPDVALVANRLLEITFAIVGGDEAAFHAAALGNALVEGQVERSPLMGGRDGVPARERGSQPDAPDQRCTQYLPAEDTPFATARSCVLAAASSRAVETVSAFNILFLRSRSVMFLGRRRSCMSEAHEDRKQHACCGDEVQPCHVAISRIPVLVEVARRLFGSAMDSMASRRSHRLYQFGEQYWRPS